MQRKVVSPIARRLLTAVAVSVSAFGAAGARGTARAEEAHPPIVLVLDPCATVDAQEVRRLVPIEMGAPLVTGAGDDGDTTRVFVGCVVGSPQLVRLEVRDPVNGRRVDRVITLVGDSKTDRARLVAIVAVELVAASRSELKESASVVAAPAPGTRALAVTATPVVPPPAPRAQWLALALGSLRHVAGLPRPLPGGGLAVTRAWPAGFALGADALLEGAAEPTALGDVDALLGSVGVVGAFRAERGRLAGEAGLGARGGFARLTGRAPSGGASSVRPGVLSAPWGGPLVAARAAVAATRHVVLSLGGELGHVTSAVAGHVQGQPDVAVSGAWWNLVLGIGYAR